MKKIIFLSAIILLLCVCAADADLAESYKLPNGLKVILKQSSYNDIVAIDVFIKGGLKAEKKGQKGINYFTATTLIKGTKTRNYFSIMDAIESRGGYMGSASTEDYSEVYCVMTKKHFETGLEVISDVLSNPAFPDGEIENVRQEILADIIGMEDDKFQLAYLNMKRKLFGDGVYGTEPVGEEDDVKNVKRSDIVGFYEKYYVPANMTLVVAGNYDKNTTKELISKYFSNFNGHDGVKPEFAPDNADYGKGKYEIKKEIKQAMVVAGFPVPGISAEEYSAIKVFSAIFGGGMSSRLFKNVRDVYGIAYEIGSFYPTREYGTAFVMYIGMDKSNVDTGIELLFKELEKAVADGITDTELEKGKNYVNGNFKIDHQTNKKQSWYLGFYESCGVGYEFDEKYPGLINKVTKEDVNRAVRKYFAREKAVVVTLIPDSR